MTFCGISLWRQLCVRALMIACVCAFTATGQPASNPPTTGDQLPEQLRQIRVAPLTLTSVDRSDVLHSLRDLCRQYAKSGHYTLRWLPGKPPDSANDRLTVILPELPLPTALQILSRCCGQDVRYVGNTVCIAPWDAVVEPAVTRELPVLPDFWKAVQTNLRLKGEPTADDVRAFLNLAAIPFPKSTEVRIGARRAFLIVTNSEENIRRLRHLLQIAWCTPFRWELTTRLVEIRKTELLDTPANQTEMDAGDALLRRLREQNGGRVLAEHAAVDLAALDASETTAAVNLTPENNLTSILRITPRKRWFDYDAFTFDVAWNCSPAEKAESSGSTQAMATTLTLCRDARLLVPVVSLSATETAPAYYLMFSAKVRWNDPDAARAPQDTAVGKSRPAFREKLQNLIIPKLELDEVPVTDVFARLHQFSVELDPEHKGVEFAYVDVDTPPKAPSRNEEPETTPPDLDLSQRTITMSMENIPLVEVVRYVCLGAGMQFTEMDGAVVIAAKWLTVESMRLQVEFQDEEAMDGASRELLFTGTSALLATPTKAEKFCADFGIEFPEGAWIRFLEFPVGCLGVSRNTEKGLRQMQMIFQMVDGQLWFDGQVATRVELFGVDDPQLQKTLESHLYPRSTRVAAETPGGKLLSGKGVRRLQDVTLTTFEGTDGCLEISPPRAGRTEGCRLTCTPTKLADGYTIRNRISWRQTTGASDERERTEQEWGATLAAFDGEPILLCLLPRDPAVTGSGDTFARITSRLVNCIGGYFRPDTTENDQPAPPPPHWTPPPETSQASDGKIVTYVPDTRFYACRSAWGDVDLPPIFGVLIEPSPHSRWRYNARTGKLAVHGWREDHEQAEQLSAANDLPFRLCTVKLATAADHVPLMELTTGTEAGEDSYSRVTRSQAGQPPQETSVRIATQELVYAHRYRLAYEFRSPEHMPQTGSVVVTPGKSVVLPGTGFEAQVEPWRGLGVPLKLPFAGAVDAHNNRLRQEQKAFELAMGALTAIKVPLFRLQQADLDQVMHALTEIVNPLRTDNETPSFTFEASRKPSFAEKPSGDWILGQESRSAEDKPDPWLYPPQFERRADFNLENRNLADILRQIQATYDCRISVSGGRSFRLIPGPRRWCRRFSVPKDTFQSVGNDIYGHFRERGVKVEKTDQLLYVRTVDTLLAAGSQAFLDAMTKALPPEQP